MSSHGASQRADLPDIALSVRQPWAWAIIHGGKDIENRSAFSVEAGGMHPARIAIHAASGMKREEYDWAVWRMAQDGVGVPRPEALPRSAIVGAVTVIEIIDRSDSPWFGGPLGLRLFDPMPCDPIPAKGARGYFKWAAVGALAAPAAWMLDWDGGDAPSLFDDPPDWAEAPRKPFGQRRKVDR